MSKLIRRAPLAALLCPPCLQCNSQRYTAAPPTTWLELRCYPPATWQPVTLCSYRCLATWALERAQTHEGHALRSLPDRLALESGDV